MLKMTLQRFAMSALAFGLFSGTAIAQLIETPALPRRDTPRSIDEQPSADSRAGGALSRDADPVRGAEIVDGADLRAAEETRGRAADVEDADATVFTGLVTGISDGRISVRMAPPRVATVTEQIFKITDETPILVDGREAAWDSIKRGQTVRITTALGDPRIATKVVVATPPQDRPAEQRPSARQAQRRSVEPEPTVTAGDLEDPSVQELDDSVNWEEHPVAPGLPGESRRAARATGGEEAVLPIGIKVFGPGQGALVTEMLVQGPAARAGVQIGDFITQVNGKPVGDPELIEEMMVDGDGNVVLTVLRGGEVLQFDVEPLEVAEGALNTMPAIRQALAVYASVGQGNMNQAATNRAATIANPFGGNLAAYDGGGVLLTGAPGALATGLQPNDVIVGFNGQPITNQADLRNALNGFTPNGQVPLSIRRGDQTTTVNLPASAFSAGTPANLDARARSLGRQSPAGTGAAAARAANGQAIPQGSSAVTGAAVQGSQTPQGNIQQGTTQGGLQQGGLQQGGAGQQGGAAGTAPPQ